MMCERDKIYLNSYFHLLTCNNKNYTHTHIEQCTQLHLYGHYMAHLAKCVESVKHILFIHPHQIVDNYQRETTSSDIIFRSEFLNIYQSV